MPASYATHEAMVSSSRMILAASGATYQLLSQPFAQLSTFALCREGTVGQYVAAAALVEAYEKHPCTLRPWWWNHVRQCGGTIEGLLDPGNVAKVIAHAQFFELENVGTEALNASIRRFIARCVQHRVRFSFALLKLVAWQLATCAYKKSKAPCRPYSCPR